MQTDYFLRYRPPQLLSALGLLPALSVRMLTAPAQAQTTTSSGAQPSWNHGPQALYDEAKKKNWTVISMKNDWKRIFSSTRGAEQMSDLVVIAFPTEAKAEEVRQKLLAMQKEYLIELGDAVIAVKDSKGKIKLNQLINTTAAGAVTGAFWGSLIGLIFLMPLAGAALGAASGTLSGYLTDIGINDKWMKETAAAVQPGTAALFVLVRKVTADKVLDRLKGEGGTVLKTSLDHTKEAALQAALAEVKAAVPASTPAAPHKWVNSREATDEANRGPCNSRALRHTGTAPLGSRPDEAPAIPPSNTTPNKVETRIGIPSGGYAFTLAVYAAQVGGPP